MLKKPGNVPTDVILVLLSDLILICKSKKGAGFTLVKPPIPLEEALFVDKQDIPTEKNIFQIVHFQVEVYTFQSFSLYDKTSWLQEAESTRSHFCCQQFDMEQGFSKNQRRTRLAQSATMNELKNLQLRKKSMDPESSRNTLEADDIGKRPSLLNLLKGKKSEFDDSAEGSRKNSKRSAIHGDIKPTPSRDSSDSMLTNSPLLEERKGIKALAFSKISSSFSQLAHGRSDSGSKLNKVADVKPFEEKASPLKNTDLYSGGDDIDALLARAEEANISPQKPTRRGFFAFKN